MDTRQLTTSDGHSLTADLVFPDGEPRGAVVVCHPHPSYGGNRFNNVVEAVFSRLPGAGFAALRFDFRDEHGGGSDEVHDVVAAIDAVADAVVGVPIAVIGYSFGAAVALRTVDDRIAALVAIAPPLAAMSVPTPAVPTIVITPQHDQFSTPEVVAPIVSGWPDAGLEVVPSADHFLVGHAGAVAEIAIAWLGDRVASIDRPDAP